MKPVNNVVTKFIFTALKLWSMPKKWFCEMVLLRDLLPQLLGNTIQKNMVCCWL